VFVLLLDTVRADRLRPFEPGFPIGRHLEELARDGILWENVASPSSWTRTAVATLFTGLAAHSHRVLDRYAVLPASLETLGEILQKHGYRTAAWSANPNVLPLWGFGQGFDVFADVGAFAWAKQKTDGRALLHRLLAALPPNVGEGWFFYVHFMDAHAPYRPPDSALRRLQAAPELAASLPRHGDAPLEQKARKEYPLYLGELVDLDRQLGGLFAVLKARGIYDSALILAVSDHGEEFLEHGDLYHGKTLYEEVLRVPAILKLPGNAAAGTRVGDPVQLADFFPTILAALGIPPPGGIDGVALCDRRGPRRAGADRPRASLLKLDGKHLAAISAGGWKYILDFRGGELLFDLRVDPREQRDRAAALPRRAARMRELLEGLLSRREAGWHLRGCGPEGHGELRFILRGVEPGAVRSREWEEGDSVAQVGPQRLEVRMRLDQRMARRERFGALVDEVVRDEDELVIAADSLQIGAEDPAALPYATGESREAKSAAEIRLDPADGSGRVPASRSIECAPAPSGLPSGSAYLRIWYIPAPEARTAAEVSPEVEDRLRMLGYGAPDRPTPGAFTGSAPQ
jgi:arylsulfatase A-like enzyme